MAAAVRPVAPVALEEGVAVIAGRTFAVVAAGKVFAEGVEAADRPAGRCQATLVCVSAEAGGLPLESTLAHALALRAELAAGAGSRARALHLLDFTLTADVGITLLAAGAFAAVGALGVLAEGAAAAGPAETLVDVDAAGAALTSRLEALVAHATRRTVDQGTL